MGKGLPLSPRIRLDSPLDIPPGRGLFQVRFRVPGYAIVTLHLLSLQLPQSESEVHIFNPVNLSGVQGGFKKPSTLENPALMLRLRLREGF